MCITDSLLQLKNLERNISKLPMKNMTDMMILNQTIEMVENNIQWINRSLETVKVLVKSYVHPTRSPETSTLPTGLSLVVEDANGDTDAASANGDTDAASANGDTDAANNNENTDDENSERLSDFERDSSSRGSCLAGDVNIIILIFFLCFQLKIIK